MKTQFIMVMIALMLSVGCSPEGKVDAPMMIARVQISAHPTNDISARHIIVTNQQSFVRLNDFLAKHSNGWKTDERIPNVPAPVDSVVIYKTTGESVRVGYSAGMLIKYKWGHDKSQQVDPSEIEEFKAILKTIRNVSGSF